MTSEQILQEVDNYIAKAQYAGLYGIALAKAKKNTVEDVEGNIYLDFLAGASTATVGYGRRDVIKSYVETAKKITHSCFVYSPNIETIEFAKKLLSITPGNFEKKVLLGLSASDSMDGAIKAARKYTAKMGVIAFHNAYHGNTGLSAQATGFPGIRNGFLQSEDFYFLNFPTTHNEAEMCLQAAEEYFQKESIACFIIEPIQGDGGNLIPPINFFSDLKKLTEKYGVVFIDDETQSGVGRTGKWWAIEHFNVCPDLMVVGKGITGGYIPLSACVGKKEIIDILDKAQHVFTYSGHPPSSAIATKIISIIEDENLMESAREKGNYIMEQLQEISKHYQNNLNCRTTGLGLQIGMSITTKNDESLAVLFGVRCLEKGLYVGYFGKNNDVLRIHPPLTITEKEVQKALKIIASVFREYQENKFPESTYERYRTHCLGLGSEKTKTQE